MKLVRTMLATLAMTLVLTAASFAQQLTKYTSPDGTFSINLPSTPIVTDAGRKESVGNLGFYRITFSVTTSNDWYTILEDDYTGSAALDVNITLNAVEKIVTDMGGSINQQIFRNNNALLDAIWLTDENGKQHKAVVYSLVVGQKTYMVFGENRYPGNTENVDASFADVITSFRLN